MTDDLPPDPASTASAAAGRPPAVRDPRKAEFEANKLRKRLRRLVGEAIGDYGLIAPHDRAAASLGQVHRAESLDGRLLACKLQYPDMASAVETDLAQLKALLALFKTMDGAIDSSEAILEVGGRLREELDYARELKQMRLFAAMLAGREDIKTPEPLEELSTKRLLTMTWLEGRGLMHWLDEPQEVRNRIAEMLFQAWWGPMTHYGVIHGDPHLGNYALTDNAERLHLQDFGCVRIFPPRFLDGVVGLYRGLKADDRDQIAHAYEIWGFKNLKRRTDRSAYALGALHLRPHARRPRSHQRRQRAPR